MGVMVGDEEETVDLDRALLRFKLIILFFVPLLLLSLLFLLLLLWLWNEAPGLKGGEVGEKVEAGNDFARL